MPEFFDIHSHLDFSDYKKDFQDVLRRMKEKKVWTITIGTDLESSKKAVEIAEANEGIFASVGQHPTSLENFDITIYRNLLKSGKVVAIGECGLDYYRDTNIRMHTNYTNEEKEKQKELFKKHIELAIKFGKPLMLHLRSGRIGNAYDEAFEILKEYPDVKGNCHFFAGNLEQAKKFVSLGFSLSFTGVITFTHDYDEVIKNIPMESIMSETDAPFVAPVPYRGKRNEPIYVEEVVKRITEIRGENLDQIKSQLVQNAIKFFNIKA